MQSKPYAAALPSASAPVGPTLALQASSWLSMGLLLALAAFGRVLGW